jgi:recombination protein RecT
VNATTASLRAQNSPTNGIAERKPKTIFDYLDDPRVKQGLATVAGRLLSPDRVMKLVTNAIYRTPNLALCEPKSVLGALMASMSLGLEPNTPQGHAYLIPFKRRALIRGQWQDVYDCQFQIGYRGLIVLGYRSPRIRSIDAETIYSGDHFKHMKGSKNFLEYEKALVNRGEAVGAYCHSHLVDDIEIATVLPLDHIQSIRDRSETFVALTRRLAEAKAAAEANPRDTKAAKDLERAQRNYDETPWVLRFDEKSSKTAVKRHVTAKLPLDPGDYLRAAIEIDNAADRGVIDLSVLADPDAAAAIVHDGEIPHDAITDHDADPADNNENTEAGKASPSDPGAAGAEQGSDRSPSPPAGDGQATAASGSSTPRGQRRHIE